MPTDYGVYRSRASRNIWLANELGLAFEHVPAMQPYRLPDLPPAGVVHTKSPEFLKVNPDGYLPSIDDDGLVLHESLAIDLYLVKKHGGPLAPANQAEDGRMSMWPLWAGIEVEALRGTFAVLDAALSKDGYPVGSRFTVADINVADVVCYAKAAPELFADEPHVEARLAASQERPAFKKMWTARDSEPA